MVFVAAGVLAHCLGFELLSGGTDEIAAEMPRHVAEIALVLVLLNDAARLDIAALRKESSLPGRLLAIGLPLTIALGGLVALGLFRGDLEFWEAILVAVILCADRRGARGRGRLEPEASAPAAAGAERRGGAERRTRGAVLRRLLCARRVDAALGSDTQFLTVAFEKIGYGFLVGAGVGLVGGALLRRSAAAGG